MTLEQERLHSVQDAARLLGGVSVSLIRKWLGQGLLTKVKIGRRTMVRERDLLRMIKPEQRKGTTYETV
jgi:hypothetical protein